MRKFACLLSGFFISVVASANAEGDAVACPSQDFTEFLTAFTQSVELQKAFTRFPIRHQYFDSSKGKPFGEPEAVVEHLNKQQIKFPVMETSAQRNKHRYLLDIVVDKADGRIAKANVYRENSDDAMSFHFVRDSCWRLVNIEDAAM